MRDAACGCARWAMSLSDHAQSAAASIDFGVNVAKQVFNCRGCGGKGRGAVDVVMFLDGVDFTDAVDRLVGDSSNFHTFYTHSVISTSPPQKAPADNDSPAANLRKRYADLERRHRSARNGRRELFE